MKCPKCGTEMVYDYEDTAQWYKCVIGRHKFYVNPKGPSIKANSALLRYELKTVETTHGNNVDYLFIDKYRLKAEDIYLIEQCSEPLSTEEPSGQFILLGDAQRYSLYIKINNLEVARISVLESELTKAKHMYNQIVSEIKELIKYE